MLVKIKQTDEVIYRNTPSKCKSRFPFKLETTNAIFNDDGKLSQKAPVPRSVEFVYEKTRFEQQALLDDTDWYLSRQLETNEPIPDDIKQLRADARAFLSS